MVKVREVSTFLFDVGSILLSRIFSYPLRDEVVGEKESKLDLKI